MIELDEGVPEREEHYAEKRVLHYAHDRLVVLWGHDLARHSHDLFDLCLCLVALRDVHIHLVAVEIGIVRRRHTQVKSESLERQDFDPMAHQRHLVKGGLPIEDDVVAVTNVPLNNIAGVKMDICSVLPIGKVYLPAIVPNDILGARPLCRTIPDQLLHNAHILAGNVFRNSQILRNELWHSELVKLENWVRRDDSPRRKVNSLAHEVSSHSSFLSFQAGPDVLEGSASRVPLLGLIWQIVIH